MFFLILPRFSKLYLLTFRGLAMAGKPKPKLSTKIQISTEAQNVNFVLSARYCQTFVSHSFYSCLTLISLSHCLSILTILKGKSVLLLIKIKTLEKNCCFKFIATCLSKFCSFHIAIILFGR